MLCNLLRVGLPSICVGRYRHLILHLVFVAVNVGDASVGLGERNANIAGSDRKFECHGSP